MVYKEYHAIKIKYRTSQEIVEKILTEKDKLFQMTQPKSTMGDYEREHDKYISPGAKGGSQTNQIEEYVMRLDESRLNDRLSEAKNIMEEWKNLLNEKEMELRKSRNIDDELYVMRFLDHVRVNEIARRTHYSKQQVYRRIKWIRESLER